jgi:hypothetical protein
MGNFRPKASSPDHLFLFATAIVFPQLRHSLQGEREDEVAVAMRRKIVI